MSLWVTIVTGRAYSTQKSWFHNWIKILNDILCEICPCCLALLQTEHKSVTVRYDDVWMFYHWMEGNTFKQLYILRLFSDLNYSRAEFGLVGQILVGKWERSTRLYLITAAEVLLSKAFKPLLVQCGCLLGGHHSRWAQWMYSAYIKVPKLIFPAWDVD